MAIDTKLAKMRIRFCTLFNSRYLARGLTMLTSLESYLRDDDEVIILALDDHTAKVLADFNPGKWRIVGVEALQDSELLTLRDTRPTREFCWTCTPALAAWMVRTSDEGDFVVHVDADLWFYRDPRELLAELGGDGSILIHEHRFASEKAHLAASTGRFNVGLVGFRTGEEARACVDRWRRQVIEKCELDPDNGYCGDQGYLNEWPELYPSLKVLQHLGGGVAPWNVNQYKVGKAQGRPVVNGVPIVFFHYHAMETIAEPRFGFVALTPAAGYSFSWSALQAIYRPYAREIKKIERKIFRLGYAIESERMRHISDIVVGVLLGRYVRVD